MDEGATAPPPRGFFRPRGNYLHAQNLGIEWYFESAKLGSEKSKKTLKKLIEEGDFEAMRFKNDPIML